LQSELNGVYKSTPPPSSSPTPVKPTRRSLGALVARKYATAFAAAFASVAISFSATAKAPYVKAEKPIKDEQGRVQVIIDFTDQAHLAYPGKLPVLPVKGAELPAEPKEFFHTEKTLALVADYEKRFGFDRLSMTSWVGNSVTSFLPTSTIARLLDDKLVKQISEDSYQSFSAQQSNVMPASGWGNSSVGNEWTSWGHQAVNGKIATSNTGRKIYIIDGGVGYHDDLPPMVRLNVSCGSSGNCNAINASIYPVVGCFGHATHVAGIIGALAGNGKTMKGAYAGFPNMISLAVTTRSSGPNCADVGPTVTTVGNALDFIAFDATQNNPNGRVHIATMSINPGGTQYANAGSPGPNWYKVKSITTTVWAYGIPVTPGILFVQSSGNVTGLVSSQANGCDLAYRPAAGINALPDDGVMVVGASHNNGGAVTPDRPFSSFTSPFSPEPTSMWPASPQNSRPYSTLVTNCMDIWAPGNLILSTWGIHPNTVVSPITLGSTFLGTTMYSGNVGTPVYGAYDTVGNFIGPPPTQGWAFLSGSSMAAPFVAAAAAWLADTYGYNTSGALELAVRSNYTLDTKPAPGQSFPAVPVVRLP
jgi:Subtilase family